MMNLFGILICINNECVHFLCFYLNYPFFVFLNCIFREPCDNVHVSNVADVGDFHITNVHQIKFKYLSVTAITGQNVEAASKLEKWIQAQKEALKKEEEAVFNDLITANEVRFC